jgi:tetratricopeptide (TPR) repeat protein
VTGDILALTDGDLPKAYEHLLRCEELASNDPQTAWLWGTLLQEDGRYVEAASAYKRVLQKFPEDRATWRNLGRTYYLDGKYEEAISAMNEVLRIDSEDRVAHYHVMLSAKALEREELAASAESAYLRYKIDESQAEVTQAYRLSHPHDNLESQLIHVHDLSATHQHEPKVTEADLPGETRSGFGVGRGRAE